MHIENVQLKHKTQDLMNQKEIASRAALADQQKKTSTLLQGKQKVVQRQRSEIKEFAALVKSAGLMVQ